jgi:hypothetical protein
MQMSISAMDNPTASESNCLQDYFKYYESEASDSEKSLDGIESSNSTAFAQVFEFTSPGSTKCKKRKSTFADYKDEKLQYLAITEALESMKLAAHWCCKLLCFSWLSTNLVLFCRESIFLSKAAKEEGSGLNVDSVRWKLLKTPVFCMLITWCLWMDKTSAVAMQLGTLAMVSYALLGKMPLEDERIQSWNQQ